MDPKRKTCYEAAEGMMRNCVMSALRLTSSGDEFKVDEMGWACSVEREDEKYVHIIMIFIIFTYKYLSNLLLPTRARK